MPKALASVNLITNCQWEHQMQRWMETYIAPDFEPKMHRYRSGNSPPQSTNHIDAFRNVPHRLLMTREGVVYLCAKLGPNRIKISLSFEN